MATANRTVLVAGGLALAAALVLGFTIARPARRDAPPPRPEPTPGGDLAVLSAAPHLLYRHTGLGENARRLSVASLEHPDAPYASTSIECDRIAFSQGHGICLRQGAGLITEYEAVFLDARLQPTRTMTLDGVPSRTRLSPDGRLGAITVFVSGAAHGYSSPTFSTKTTLVDLNTGATLGDLEQFTTTRDGQPFSAKDFNFWGVTFARDGKTFYASLRTGGKTYLVRGDMPSRTMTVLHENVECPSLSPDNTRVAYKKRVGGDLAPWRFHVLDLATMTEHPIAAETRSIDDQIEWLDDGHVLYAAGRGSQSAILDVWVAPIQGSAGARAFLLQAASPVVVR